MEAKVHYDLKVTEKNPKSPSWTCRILFLAGVSAASAYAYYSLFPDDFVTRSTAASAFFSANVATPVKAALASGKSVVTRNNVITLTT